jgi:uncharacterized protein with HEPN domain
LSRDRPFLLHIVDACERIERYTTAGKEEFLADAMVQDAVLRNLEVIGEAVKGLSEEARADAPDIPWRQIAGLRDRLIHAYFGVDLHLVWDVVERQMPPLHRAVGALLEQ